MSGFAFAPTGSAAGWDWIKPSGALSFLLPVKIHKGVPEELVVALRRCPSGQIRHASRLGLEIEPGIGREAWSQLICHLAQEAGGCAWRNESLLAWMGDVLAYGGDQYRGQIREYAVAARVSPGSLRNAKLVCGRIPTSCRRDALSWSHHCEIGMAWSSHEVIESWLQRVEKEKLSRNELRRLIRLEKQNGRESKPAGASRRNDDLELMRELRFVNRRLRKSEQTWRQWGPDVLVLAAKELDALAKFTSSLVAHAVTTPTC